MRPGSKRRKTFSYLRICILLAHEMGTPYLEARLLYPGTYHSASITRFSLFLLKPSPWAVSGLVSTFFGFRGFGMQQLYVDSVVSFVAWIFLTNGPNRFNNVFKPYPGNNVASKMNELDEGMFLTRLPGLTMSILLILLGFFLLFTLIVVCYNNFKSEFSSLWKISLSSLFVLAILTIGVPFLAVYELGLFIFRKGSNRFVQWIRNFADKLLQERNIRWLPWVVFAVWFVVLFVGFIGNWMAIVTLIPAAGDAFCPASLQKVTVSYVFLTIGTLILAGVMDISSPVEETADGD
jgi:hypothetical protein